MYDRHIANKKNRASKSSLNRAHSLRKFECYGYETKGQLFIIFYSSFNWIELMIRIHYKFIWFFWGAIFYQKKNENMMRRKFFVQQTIRILFVFDSTFYWMNYFQFGWLVNMISIYCFNCSLGKSFNPLVKFSQHEVNICSIWNGCAKFFLI